MTGRVMAYEVGEEMDMGDPVAGQTLDVLNQILQQSIITNQLLTSIASGGTVGTNKDTTKDEAYEIGARVAAMDTKRDFSERPPKPEVPQWAWQLAEKLDDLAEKSGKSSTEIAEMFNPLLIQRGHSPMAPNYIQKLRTPGVSMHSWTKNAWQVNVNIERPRVQDIIALTDYLLGN